MKEVPNDTKILDFSHSFGRPFCVLLLKELGAEIIKESMWLLKILALGKWADSGYVVRNFVSLIPD